LPPSYRDVEAEDFTVEYLDEEDRTLSMRLARFEGLLSPARPTAAQVSEADRRK
jgi:hypothetical protein